MHDTQLIRFFDEIVKKKKKILNPHWEAIKTRTWEKARKQITRKFQTKEVYLSVIMHTSWAHKYIRCIVKIWHGDDTHYFR